MRKLLAHLLAGKYIESILLTNSQLSDTVAEQGRTINALKKTKADLNNEYGKLWNDHTDLIHKYGELKHKHEALQLDYEDLQTDLEQMTKARDLQIDICTKLRKQNQRLGGKYTAALNRIKKQEKE